MAYTNNDTLSLIYDAKIDSKKSYLFKVDNKFIQQLNQYEEMIIQGQSTDQLILNIPTTSYKLKGVNISTTFIVIQSNGIIHKQTSSYLQLQKFNPYFHQIYQKISNFSCKIPDKQQIQNYQQLVKKCSFTQHMLRKWGYLGEKEFVILSNAMGLVKLQGNQMGEQPRYVYVTLQLAVWILRQIIAVYNQSHINLIQPISTQLILVKVPILSPAILAYIQKYFQIEVEQNSQNPQYPNIKLTLKSIIRYIFAQMALAKKQYSSYTFDQVLDEMLMIYMPAQIQISSSIVKQSKDKSKQKDKILQQLWTCRYEYFLDVKGQKYVYYDYMQIQTQINSRIKYLSNYKNRWKYTQLKNIFRGVDSTQGNKFFTLADILLKKFRKFGDQYQIKFILPNQ